MSRLRRDLYRAARGLGDVEAATKGPVPMAKRLVRKRAYRKTGTTTRLILRSLGLSK